MLFDEIIGHENLIKHLKLSVDNGRIPHAQIFSGLEGAGTLPLAIAYAQYVLVCQHTHGSENHQKALLKAAHFNHPDLHFSFPVAANDQVKAKPVSDLFIEAWRNFVNQSPYGSLYDWLQHIGIDNKQGFIGVDEAYEMNRKLSLKSYEGGYQIMLVWMAEKMNNEAANKLLKLIEEPAANTLLLLMCKDESQLLPTILSRCQVVKVANLSLSAIAEALKTKYKIPAFEAEHLALKAGGDFQKAIQLLQPGAEEIRFEEWFVRWVRLAFSAKGNKHSVLGLLTWAEEIAAEGRETQKNFLIYCQEMFRQAFLCQLDCKALVFFESKQVKFDLNKFAPFVHLGNVYALFDALEEAYLHIERNGNSKMVFTDLSIKLTRLLHLQKEMV